MQQDILKIYMRGESLDMVKGELPMKKICAHHVIGRLRGGKK